MEVAAMMYGISLSKDGTTKVVAQRLDQQTSLETDARLEGDREAAAAAFAPQTSADDEPVIEVPQEEPVG
jgi:hypothetical protein